ncbi:3-dehydroquinate synthase [Desulforamulus hydrothermalis]|uniref:3-dehydroquinate synthase n=1 Tax=Desulforamulus hydrothermalis Lam5 = DSM 18033 TaxID=1121428 RepID=K8EJZ9_9FIRM|nr:3-dehydroquinate synthase [Desulforamulus hydrothermalis]CCO08866.1 3-dehydroquinate synthase [Desulforamulus hydrothermalis Lam5 = DSM 18033]SHG73558.1 3-dehydroquinate synthase [Desulforamulus hydrothermalis Lam5 = DSM 18033]
MRKINLALGERSYPIYLEDGGLNRLGYYLQQLPLEKKALLITDSNVYPLYGEKVAAVMRQAGFQVAVARVPAGEQAKTLEQAARLYDLAFDAGLDRSCPVVALGGGVVGDLAGFVAATYMRGVPFIQVPTTLLAQVDSSVGGKVAVNHPRGKNIIGAFYQPRLVLIDVATLQTLPARQLKAGLAEVIKYGVIWDGEFFQWLENNGVRLLAQDRDALQYVIETCCRIKAAVVEQDETEQGRRAILNYGHTVGHAVEALTGYDAFLHGEAVAIGMVIAARMAVQQGLLGYREYHRIKQLIALAELPAELPADLAHRDILQSIYHDKKVKGDQLVFILPQQIGRVGIYRDIDEKSVMRALKE